MPSVGTPPGVNYTTLANLSGTAQNGTPIVVGTTTLNHGLAVGQLITIAGTTVAAHDGDWEVVALGDESDNSPATKFRFQVTSVTSSSGGTGTVLSRTNEFSGGLVAGDNIQLTKNGNRVQITGASSSGGSGNTLDGAYDQGGTGAGRTIAANNGAVAITVADGSNNNALEITQSDDNNNKDGILVTMEGTGAGLRVKGATNDTARIQLDNDDATAYFVMSLEDSGAVELEAQDGVTITTNDSSLVLNPGNISDGGAAALVQIVDGTKGLTIGPAPSSDFAENSLNIGDNTRCEGTGITIGELNTVVSGPSIALGRLNTVVDSQGIAMGDGATTSGFEQAASICLSDGTQQGTTASSNTLVLDSGAQYGTSSPASGPIGTGAAELAGTSGRGNIYLESGTIHSGSADYAELFEWDDGNTNSADRRGFFVSLVNGNKIEIGNANIVGIVSARPVILGDAAALGWHGRYILDDFGAPVQELRDGVMSPKINPNFNMQTVYTPRITRKEWTPVGLLGKLFVRSAQTLTAGSKCTSNSSGYAVSGNDYHILRVMRQPTNTLYGIVEILMK